MSNKLLLCSAAIIAAVSFSVPAGAETVTTKTYVKTKELPHVNKVNFSVFDINNDGIYSMDEVGERLFNSFDRNSDQLIDNTEWDRKAVMTIAPMEQETYKFIDYDDDGMAEESVYTYKTFYQASGLIRFDENQDGLSAKEFINTDFLELDKDDNKMISLEEWKDAYMASRPKHDQPESYNQ